MQFDAPNSAPQPEGFEDWETNAAKAVVHSFIAARGPFRNLAVEDLLQEALESWWRERHGYDPSRGASEETFLSRVVTNRLRDLRREELALKRTGDRTAVSFDQLADGEGAGRPEEPHANNPSRDPERVAEASDLAKRVRRASERLSGRQQAIATGLAEDKTPTALSGELGISRMTFYKDRDRIRCVFEEEGLEDFLK